MLDNARIHHGSEEKIRNRGLREHNMLLLYLPAYNPELNLIEIIWKQAKYHTGDVLSLELRIQWSMS
nr:transposase [Xenorhabdus stockiae]